MGDYTIVALDPGGTTGWASLNADAVMVDEYNEIANTEWRCGQLGPDKHHKELAVLLEMNHTAHYTIVCESFEYRNQSRPGLELVSKEYIGVAEYIQQDRNIAPVVYQGAAQGKVGKKSFVKKVNLERLGLWSPGYPHAMDGYGHLLYYIIHSKLPEFLDLRHALLEKGWRGGA